MTSCDIGLRRRALFEGLVTCLFLSFLLSPVIGDPSLHSPTGSPQPSHTESLEDHTQTLNIELVDDDDDDAVSSSSDIESIYGVIAKEGFLIGEKEPIEGDQRPDESLSLSERETEEPKGTSERHVQGKIEFGGHEVMLKEKHKPLLQAVPLDEFLQEIQQVRTYHDVIRLFYTDHAQGMSNGQLTRLFLSQILDHTHLPQRVGLSAPLGPPRTPQGEIEERDMSDVMMSDSPCPQCHVVPASPSFWAPMEHRKRHKRKEVGDNSGDSALTQGRRYLSQVHKRNRRDMKKATEHVQRMAGQWECGEPTPIVVHIKDLQRSANRMYEPDCTIIHKCQKTSGCCGHGKTCGVKSAVNVTLHFWAPELSVDGEVSFGADPVETFTFENHTECECKSVPVIPHCAPCPPPFIQYYKDQVECRCGCLDDDKECKSIKRGRGYFSTDTIECLKNGECAFPVCTHGNFTRDHIDKGRCPHKKERKRKSKHSQNGQRHHNQKKLHSEEAKMTVSGKKEESLSSDEAVGLGSGANEQLDVH